MNRRDFIRRMGLTTGSFLLNPILDTLIAQAWGQAINTKRLVIYMSGGFMPTDWTTTGGANPNFTLPEIYSPLEPYKKDMLILRNLYSTVYKNLHGNLYGTLSGYPCIGPNDDFAYLNARPGGPSVDTLLSNELGGGTRHKEMCVGYTRPSQTGLAYAYDKVKPTSMNLTDTFNTYIAGPLPSSNPMQAQQMRKNILDFAAGDIQKAYRGLAGEEKSKFEQFLASVKEIASSITASTPVANPVCSTQYQLPSTGTGLNGQSYPAVAAYGGDLANRPWWQDGRGFCGSNYIHADMAALALGCGVTRHVTFVSAYHEAHQFYPDIGIARNQHADIAHTLEESGYTNASAIRDGKEILKYHASVVGKIYDKLKKTPEGNGTAADNTILLWFSDVGGSHHYGHYGYTALMLGNAGGALKTGASYSYGAGQYSMNQLYLTIAQAIGSTMKQVGDGTNPGNTVIPGLLA